MVARVTEKANTVQSHHASAIVLHAYFALAFTVTEHARVPFSLTAADDGCALGDKHAHALFRVVRTPAGTTEQRARNAAQLI